MNRITLVDYIGYCDSKGEVTGHTAKTLKETKEMLSDPNLFYSYAERCLQCNSE